MENYVVSARKYRPQTFETVVGQKALTETLQNAIRSGHLAHAYLFCGPRGVGKTTCARIFAKTINAIGPNDDLDQYAFNIHELDAASNNSVEDIRQIIKEVLVPPQVGRYSVFIIDEVHMLSTGAFNALLKTLEEPPSYAIFILATTEKHKILPTILSRCQVYDFGRITVSDIISHLRNVAEKEGVNVGDDSLNVIAQKADGGMRDALSIFDQLVSFAGQTISYERTIEVLNVLDTEYYFRLTDFLLAGDVSGALLLLNEVLTKGFDAQQFVVGYAQHLRDVLVSKDPQTLILLETSDSIRQHFSEHAKSVSAVWIYKALDILNATDIQYRTAKNKRLTIELGLIKLSQLNVAPAPVAAAPTPAAQPTNASAPKPAPAPAAPKPTAAPTVTPAAAPVMPSATKPAAQAAMPQMPTARPASAPPPSPTPAAPTAPQMPVMPQSRPFTDDQLQSAWTGLSRIYSDQPRLQTILTEHYPIRVSQNELKLILDSSLQQDLFRKKGKELMDRIRATLGCDELVLRLEVDEQVRGHQAYTAEEKYHVLLNQNPELQNLKDALDLQIE